MELRQLKYFEKAYEYQNFSEASRLLFISHSRNKSSNLKKSWIFCYSTASESG